MTAAPVFVPGVPGLCRVLCRVFHWCAGCAGSRIGVRTYRKTKNARIKNTPSRVYVPGTPGTPGTCLIHIRISDPHPAHHPAHPAQTRHARARNSPIYFFKGKKMEKTHQAKPAQASRTIRCTLENAGDMQKAVKAWPELHALVQSLQAQGLFPGLRGLSITLTGRQELLDKGLAAVAEINAPKAN